MGFVLLVTLADTHIHTRTQCTHTQAALRCLRHPGTGRGAVSNGLFAAARVVWALEVLGALPSDLRLLREVTAAALPPQRTRSAHGAAGRLLQAQPQPSNGWGAQLPARACAELAWVVARRRPQARRMVSALADGVLEPGGSCNGDGATSSPPGTCMAWCAGVGCGYGLLGG